MDVKKLYNAKHHRKLGHHRCVVNYNKYTGEKESIDFFHHNVCICNADLKNKTYFISDEGYATATTHRALVQYMKFFDGLGYKMRGCYIVSTYVSGKLNPADFGN